MDIKNVITSSANAVIEGVDEAKKNLEGRCIVEWPTRIEIEFGITSTYEIANYDDFGSLVAKVRVSVPLLKPAATGDVAPASKALMETALAERAEKDKTAKTEKTEKKTTNKK